MITAPAGIAEALRQRNFTRLKIHAALYINTLTDDGYFPADVPVDISASLKKAPKIQNDYDSSLSRVINGAAVTLTLDNLSGKFFEGKQGSLFDGKNTIIYNSKIVISLYEQNAPEEKLPVFTGYVNAKYSFKIDSAEASYPLDTGWQNLESVPASILANEQAIEQLTISAEDEEGKTFLTTRPLVAETLEVRIGQTWDSGAVQVEEQDFEVDGRGNPDGPASIVFYSEPAAAVWARYTTWPTHISVGEALAVICERVGLQAAKIETPEWTNDIAVDLEPGLGGAYGAYQQANSPKIIFNSWPDGRAGGSMTEEFFAPKYGDWATNYRRRTDFAANKETLYITGFLNAYTGPSSGYFPYESWISGYCFGDDAGHTLWFAVWGDAEDARLQAGGAQVGHIDLSGAGPNRKAQFNFDLQILPGGTQYIFNGGPVRDFGFTPTWEAVSVFNEGKTTMSLQLDRYVGSYKLTEEDLANGWARTDTLDLSTYKAVDAVSAPVAEGVGISIVPETSPDASAWTAQPAISDGTFWPKPAERYVRFILVPGQQNTLLQHFILPAHAVDVRLPYLVLDGSVADFIKDCADLFGYESGYGGDGEFFFRKTQEKIAVASDFGDDKIIKFDKISSPLQNTATRVRVELGDRIFFWNTENENLKKMLGVVEEDFPLPKWLTASAWDIAKTLGKYYIARISTPRTILQLTAVGDPLLQLGDGVRIMHNAPGTDVRYADWFNFEKSPGYWRSCKITSISIDFSSWKSTMEFLDFTDEQDAPEYTGTKFKFNLAAGIGAAEEK